MLECTNYFAVTANYLQFLIKRLADTTYILQNALSKEN